MLVTATAKYWFISGCVLMLLFGLAHLGGVVYTLSTASANPRLQQQFQSQREFELPAVAGMQTTLWNLRQFFNFSFSVLLISWAVTDLAAWRIAGHSSPALRTLSIITGLGMLIVFCLALKFRVAQGAVTAGLVVLLFSASAVLSPSDGA